MLKTQERQEYERLLESFRQKVPKGEVVYDIGKSVKWDYRDLFKDHKYFSVDCNPKVKPDLVVDFEDYGCYTNIDQPFGVLCNGVTEQCYNPFRIFQNIYTILKPNGIVLFGICLAGYPLYGVDYLRFTEKGALRALEQEGFKIKSKYTVKRMEPSYLYCFCTKL